jgi:arylsulfatase
MYFYRTIVTVITLSILSACSQDSDERDAISGKLSSASQTVAIASDAQRRPNILLIVADDLGYTDLGAFGGEINTPNLDELAEAGMVLSNFHTNSACSPTRSMLLSGTDNHRAGLGSMPMIMRMYTPELLDEPGYEGVLNFSVAAMPELLQDAGYRTYMTGKWDLGLTNELAPASRGFERSYVLLEGGGSHLNDMGILAGTTKAKYAEDGMPTKLADNFYSTKVYAEKMIEYLQQGQADETPFFAYLSFTAPHWPLQAPQESIAKYHGRYDAGYEVLLEQRLRRQKELGLIKADAAGPDLSQVKRIPGWDELTDDEKKRSARTMEIYAAMVDDVDHYVGSVIDALKEIGEYENTFIVFMSDNGAQRSLDMDRAFGIGEAIEICCDNSYENMGNANSYIGPAPGWPRVSTGSNSLHKTFPTEGGTRVPAIISYPNRIDPGQYHDGFISVMDIMPTFLDLAETEHPGDTYKGREVVAMSGTSINNMMQGQVASVHGEEYVMGWELFGRHALRKGHWKIVQIPPPFGSGEWELFNLADDPLEANDLTEQKPEKLQEMLGLWAKYVRENGVIISGNDWDQI